MKVEKLHAALWTHTLECFAFFFGLPYSFEEVQINHTYIYVYYLQYHSWATSIVNRIVKTERKIKNGHCFVFVRRVELQIITSSRRWITVFFFFRRYLCFILDNCYVWVSRLPGNSLPIRSNWFFILFIIFVRRNALKLNEALPGGRILIRRSALDKSAFPARMHQIHVL